MLKLLTIGREEDLWHMCCGFVDLKLPQFMTIQRRLLMEQIQLLSKCPLGARRFGGVIPETVEEFRKQVRLTTYADYYPDLSNRRTDILPAKPVLWQHTSGKTGEYGTKWIPLTSRFCQEVAKLILGIVIFSGHHERNNVSKLKENPSMIYAVAPRPYTSGTIVYILQKEFPIRSLPPLEEAEKMSFEDRIREGFRLAISVGLDGFGGLSLALVAIGERFCFQMNRTRTLSLLKDPRAFWRVITSMVKSKMSGRDLLPKDLWPVKGITSSGTDTVVFRDKIKELWGRYPLDTYINTEGCIIATQTWDYKDMTFVPNLNFLEFIPEKECDKLNHNYDNIPHLLLLDEVRPGEIYELVITNYHGGAMVRYRTGDLVRITRLRNDELNIDIPQMAFESRGNDLIDLGGYVRLNERTIWQAMENIGIPYEDWTAYKETSLRPVLNLYLELKQSCTLSQTDLAAAVYNEIKRLDERVNSAAIYDSLVSMLGRIPITVHLLESGAFKEYARMQQAKGSDLAHLKPPHINPGQNALSFLLSYKN